MKIKSLLLLSFSFFAATSFSAPAKVDNSNINKRDRNDGALTADDQMKGTKSDVETTRVIRREITNDKSLSTYAHNIKIVTHEGQVTLRGPVKSEDEKMKVASIAKRAAGDSVTLNNDLEITK